MKRAQMQVYALALAILVVGLGALGVPLGTVFVSLAALACPLMMIFMMGGMHGGHGHGHGRPDEPADRHGSETSPAAGDRDSAHR
jgi:hypothetical protein